MSKTIQQRLQSRISRRRNVIREAEGEVSMLVQQRRWQREEGEVNNFTNESIGSGKKFIAVLADDQKLDKALGRIVLGLSRQRRHYGLSDF